MGNLKQCLGDYVNEECVRVRYNGEVMAYEQNNKLYSSVKLKFEVRTPIGIWKEFVLLITPFNCYFYRWNENIDFRNDKHIEFTKLHRSTMKEKYGEVYKNACKKFITEVREMRSDLERELYQHKIKVINNDFSRDIELVNL